MKSKIAEAEKPKTESSWKKEHNEEVKARRQLITKGNKVEKRINAHDKKITELNEQIEELRKNLAKETEAKGKAAEELSESFRDTYEWEGNVQSVDGGTRSWTWNDMGFLTGFHDEAPDTATIPSTRTSAMTRGAGS